MHRRDKYIPYFVRKPEGQEPLGRRCYRLLITMKNTGCGHADWMEVAGCSC
jgi:hypothetical protein